MATQLVMREQPSAEALIAVAEEHDARMIVVGSYGERPLKSALVGSTPTRLLHLAERPVLVVRVPNDAGSATAPCAPRRASATLLARMTFQLALRLLLLPLRGE